MILGGDELSHSQEGNNNTYCQDSELTWLKWDLDERQKLYGQLADYIWSPARLDEAASWSASREIRILT